MKKIILLLICVFAVSVSSAQYYKNNILGLRAGMNATSLSLGDNLPSNVKRPTKIGWHFGISDQILLSQHLPFYFETGLYFSNKGGGWKSTAHENEVVTTRSETVGMTYLQIPLKINYHFLLDDFTIEPFIGFHYALGLWGRNVFKENIDDNSNSANDRKSKEVSKIYTDDGLRRSDIGISLGVGATWLDFYAGLAWETGFLNLSKNRNLRVANTSNFMIMVGYNF